MSKSLFSVLLIFLSIIAFSPLTGCNSGVNNQNSVTSGTTTGFGGSGGIATQVSVIAGNTQIASGGTTPITIIVTDAQGRRTDASIILTSSRGGSFAVTSTSTTTTNVTTTGSTIVSATTNTVLTGFTVGGSLSTTFTFVAVTGTTTAGTTVTFPINTEITAFISGTTVKGSIVVSITD